MRARDDKPKTKPSRAKSEKIEISSGNVFSDLGLEDSEERLRKAKLVNKIAQRSKKRVGELKQQRRDR